MKKRMRLIGYLLSGPTSHNYGMWRHPFTSNNVLDAARYENIARTLEAGFFDVVFFADLVAVPGIDTHENRALARAAQIGLLDPLPLLAIMSRVTRHIGLAATVTTTFNPTYLLARSLATLDVLSGGRVAWNVVTSSSAAEARNFGLEAMPQKDARYDHADEVLEACDRLWSSWDDGALVLDKKTGLYVDLNRLHHADYRGKTVSTRGPLTVPRSPQGRPVIMQAGSSDRGRDFAARWAEIIFVVQHRIEDMIDFYRDLKARMAKLGRNPDDCAICIAVDPIIGETQKIAEEKLEYSKSLIDDEVGINLLAVHTGADITKYPAHTPFKDVIANLKDTRSAGMLAIFKQLLEEDSSLTLREVSRRYALSMTAPILVGTPTDVAARQREYFEAGACDGFIILPSEFPGTFETYTRSVVPILQEQGLVQTQYAGRTLRENLRLRG